MAIICFVLQKFSEYENRRLIEVDGRRFHEAFRRALFLLAEQKMDVVPFTWNDSKKQYKEVQEALQELVESGCFRYKGDSTYEYTRQAQAIFWSRCKEITNMENLKFRNASEYAFLAYIAGVSFEDALKATGSVKLAI